MEISKNVIEKNLSYIMEIGKEMLIYGAEISRVEDTINRLCTHLGADEADIFTTPYVIVTTIKIKDEIITQTRRINGFSYNLDAISKYNNLSRKICQGIIKFNQVEEKIQEIKNQPKVSLPIAMLAYCLISFGFTLFFGGSIKDALIAGVIGAILRVSERFLQMIKLNRFIIIIVLGFIISSLSNLAIYIGVGQSKELISIGITMILISGLLFTNSIREMFMDNIMSGATKFVEAIFIASAIYIGFALEILMFGA